MTLKLSFSCYVLFCYWKYSKQPFNCLQYELKLSLCCYLFGFAIGNTVKQPFSCSQYDTQTVLGLLLLCFCYWKYGKEPFNCLQYDTQTVLVLLLICFAIGNTVKQPFNCLNVTLKLFWSCYCFVLSWKYSKATVQLSPIWHSNCSGSCYCFVLLLEIQ